MDDRFRELDDYMGLLYSQVKMVGKNCLYSEGVIMKVIRIGLAKYPAKYHFSTPIRQEMLYKEYWNVL